jgi:hypothetical protein
MITALLLYFGWVWSRAYFRHFGLTPEILQYSNQDYLLRSIDTAFGSSVRALAAASLLVLLEGGSSRLTANRIWVQRWVAPILPHVALTLWALGLALAAGIGHPRVPASASAAILMAGSWLLFRQREAVSEFIRAPVRLMHISATIAALLGALWAANLYAEETARQTASSVESSLEFLPEITVFSDKYLDLPGTLVKATKVTVTSDSDGYRYSGMRLLAYSNHRWFLLTGKQTAGSPLTVTILEDREGIRVELSTHARQPHFVT